MRVSQRKQIRPAFEMLEGKLLLSGQGAAPLALSQTGSIELAQTTAAPFIPAIALRGTAKGHYTAEHSNPDTGTTYRLFATGRLPHFGSSVVVGTLSTPGNLAQGRSGGTLRVITAGGSLTLQLTGPVQPGFSPLPSHFQFTITGATGRFHGETGGGTVDITLRPDHHGPAQGPALLTQQHGGITLKFSAPQAVA